MAKAGKGVRTRQYNPGVPKKKKKGWAGTGQTREQWYRSLAKEAQAAIPPHRRPIDHLPIPLRGKRNPGANNLAQYVQAAVDHTRGAHDAGGKVIHETPKNKRRDFAREIAFRKGYRKNPNEAAEADALYKKFHGRGPDKIQWLLVNGIDPYGDNPALTSLGPCVRLIVGEDVELEDDEDSDSYGEVVDSTWHEEINFVPMNEYRRAVARLDPDDKEAIRHFRAKLKAAGCPDVAGVPPKGEQLYLVGGNQALDESDLKRLGCDPAKDVCDLGYCCVIEYLAQKRFDRFEPMTYFHALGEDSGVQPRLLYWRKAKLLQLAGGSYVVKAAGIED
jgi:hypothetical protein